MGVFLYCNKQIDTEEVKNVYKTRGHNNIVSEIRKGETIVYAGKILADSIVCLSGNSLNITNSDNSDDYIIGVGTYFYKGLFGVDALKMVYQNFDDVIKNNPIYGHWAFVVHKSGTTYVLNDMSGTLRLYYYENNGKIVVSSSPLAVVVTMSEPKLDKVLLSAYLAGHYGRDIAPIKDLKNVDPLKLLQINGDNFKWIDRDVPETKRIDTLDEAVDYVRALFGEQIKQLKAIGDERISIELTAGLDSRLIASNLKTGGFVFDFLNYPLFGPDKQVASLIANGLNVKLLEQTNERLFTDFDSHYGEWDYGFNLLRSYYANPRWIFFNRFQFSGGRGECLDLPDIYSDKDVNMMKDPRLVSLLQPLTTTEIMNDEKRDAYLEYEKVFYKERGFDVEKILTEKEQMKFDQMLCGQLTGDYMYNSGVQAHLYFYQIYNEWHFNHFISDISFKQKSGRKLTLQLIKSIDPELGSYPFVSRRRTKRKSVNETSELPLQYWSYNGIKKMLPKVVVDYMYSRMGRVFPNEKLKQIDMHLYDDVVKTELLIKYPNLYNEILQRMYSIDVLRKKLKIGF